MRGSLAAYGRQQRGMLLMFSTLASLQLCQRHTLLSASSCCHSALLRWWCADHVVEL
jgi:hypothetical protein